MSKTITSEYAAFEAWYAENAFNYERNPIGSREFEIQWTAWQGAVAHLTAREQAVDVEAIQAVAFQLKTRRLFGNSATWDDCDFFSNKLTRAISPAPNKDGA